MRDSFPSIAITERPTRGWQRSKKKKSKSRNCAAGCDSNQHTVFRRYSSDFPPKFRRFGIFRLLFCLHDHLRLAPRLKDSDRQQTTSDDGRLGWVRIGCSDTKASARSSKRNSRFHLWTYFPVTVLAQRMVSRSTPQDFNMSNKHIILYGFLSLSLVREREKDVAAIIIYHLKQAVEVIP